MRFLPLLLFAALGSGACAGLAGVPPAWLTVAIAIAGTCAHAVLWHKRPGPALACALAAIAGAGAALASDAERRARDPPLAAQALQAAGGEIVWLTGRLTADGAPTASGARLTLVPTHVGGAPAAAPGEISLGVGGALTGGALDNWRGGRTVRLPARVRRPARYLDAGVPDHQLQLARRGLVLVGSVKSAALVEIVARGSPLDEAAAAARAHVRRVLSSHVGAHDPTAAAIAIAILIGDRASLDTALEERLQAAGTYHVIAISGGNIALLTAALMLLVRLVRVRGSWQPIAVAAALVLHASVVGAGPSVVRATAMALVYLGLSALDQRAWSLNALAGAAAAMLLASPLAIVEPGFVLSAGATAAIIALTPPLLARVPARAWWRPAAAVLAASLAAELVLLPVSATLFNRVTAAGLALNLLAVPLMAVVQFSGLAVVLLDACSETAARLAGAVTAAAARGLVEGSAPVAWWPWLVRRVPSPAVWNGALYLGALALAFSARHLDRLPGRWRWRLARTCPLLAAAAAAWLLTAPSTWPWPWRADGWLRVTMLDVGQGDATLVQFPDGQRWLVDTGGLPGAASFDIGARVVAPALWARGVGRLDRLVLTHGDPDHVGGAAAVIDDFRPRGIWEGVPVPSHVALLRLRAQSAGAGAVWTTAPAGVLRHPSGVTVHVWHPPPPDWERQRVRNDDSIVLELRYGDVSIVLPGDISATVERDLAPRLQPARLRVLKLAHHGSATSTSEEWLDALRPSVAIASCGRDNPFGHPSASVLGRLKARGVDVYRTDRDGEITVETNGNHVRMRTFFGQTSTVAVMVRPQH